MSRRTDPHKIVAEATEIIGAQSSTAPKTGLGDDHPLNDIIGTYDGPTWEQILKNIKRNRKRADMEYRRHRNWK